jgi:hypothetical protein
VLKENTLVKVRLGKNHKKHTSNPCAERVRIKTTVKCTRAVESGAKCIRDGRVVCTNSTTQAPFIISQKSTSTEAGLKVEIIAQAFLVLSIDPDTCLVDGAARRLGCDACAH